MQLRNWFGQSLSLMGKHTASACTACGEKFWIPSPESSQISEIYESRWNSQFSRLFVEGTLTRKHLFALLKLAYNGLYVAMTGHCLGKAMKERIAWWMLHVQFFTAPGSQKMDLFLSRWYRQSFSVEVHLLNARKSTNKHYRNIECGEPADY